MLVDVGVQWQPFNSLEVYRLLRAFQNNPSHPGLGDLIESFPASFWRSHVPGFSWKPDAAARNDTTAEQSGFPDHEEYFFREKPWYVVPISAHDGDDW